MIYSASWLSRINNYHKEVIAGINAADDFEQQKKFIVREIVLFNIYPILFNSACQGKYEHFFNFNGNESFIEDINDLLVKMGFTTELDLEDNSIIVRWEN